MPSNIQSTIPVVYFCISNNEERIIGCEPGVLTLPNAESNSEKEVERELRKLTNVQFEQLRSNTECAKYINGVIDTLEKYKQPELEERIEQYVDWIKNLIWCTAVEYKKSNDHELLAGVLKLKVGEPQESLEKIKYLRNAIYPRLNEKQSNEFRENISWDNWTQKMRPLHRAALNDFVQKYGYFGEKDQKSILHNLEGLSEDGHRMLSSKGSLSKFISDAVLAERQMSNKGISCSQFVHAIYEYLGNKKEMTEIKKFLPKYWNMELNKDIRELFSTLLPENGIEEEEAFAHLLFIQQYLSCERYFRDPEGNEKWILGHSKTRGEKRNTYLIEGIQKPVYIPSGAKVSFDPLIEEKKKESSKEGFLNRLFGWDSSKERPIPNKKEFEESLFETTDLEAHLLYKKKKE